MVSASHTVLCVALVLFCLAACLDSAQAQRGRKKGKPCRYRKIKDKDCDPVENTRNLTFTLKKGDPECPETKTHVLSCRKRTGCEYEKGAASWSECDPHTNRRSLVKSRAEGSPEDCPATHTRVRRCKTSRKRGGRGNRKKQGGRKFKKNKKQRKGRKGKAMRRKNRKASKAARANVESQ